MNGIIDIDKLTSPTAIHETDTLLLMQNSYALRQLTLSSLRTFLGASGGSSGGEGWSPVFLTSTEAENLVNTIFT